MKRAMRLRGLPRNRRTRKNAGVTLIEVMIVVVILGLIAGGVAVAVLPKYTEAKIKTTRTSAVALRQAAESWRADNGGDQCPTPALLMQARALDANSKITDAWDDPFKITCEPEETYVASAGPDKRDGTADDIRVPPGASTAAP